MRFDLGTELGSYYCIWKFVVELVVSRSEKNRKCRRQNPSAGEALWWPPRLEVDHALLCFLYTAAWHQFTAELNGFAIITTIVFTHKTIQTKVTIKKHHQKKIKAVKAEYTKLRNHERTDRFRKICGGLQAKVSSGDWLYSSKILYRRFSGFSPARNRHSLFHSFELARR